MRFDAFPAHLEYIALGLLDRTLEYEGTEALCRLELGTSLGPGRFEFAGVSGIDRQNRNFMNH